MILKIFICFFKKVLTNADQNTIIVFVRYAEVLELADRLDSGSSVGSDVRVQVPSSALDQKRSHI